MVANVQSRVLDLGLNVLDTEATHLELCSSEPTTYTEATSTFNLGTNNFTVGLVFGSPAAGTPNGRKVTSAAVTAGTVSATGTAGWLAVTDRTNTRLLAVIQLSATQAVTSGNTWSCASFDVSIPSQ